jgi:peptidyl-tRNA hydrolase
VLAKFNAKDRQAFDVAVAIAADATQAVVESGAEAAMQRFNSR